MSQNSIKIIYKWQPYNKVNGTLFYCFEYLIQLSLLGKVVDLVIYNIDDKHDEILIEQCFKNKYQFVYFDCLNFINYKKSMLNVKQNINNDICVFLDIYTFNDIGKLFKHNKKFAYINNNYNDTNYKIKDIENTTYFGYYDYQYINNSNFIKSLLKPGLKFQRDFGFGDYIFVSCPEYKDELQSLPETNYLFKDKFQIIPDLFDKIYKVIYIHNQLDTNNRIIPEAFYHKKEVYIMDYFGKNDSIIHRYNLCKEDINQLILDEKDLMIQHIIGNANGNEIK